MATAVSTPIKSHTGLFSTRTAGGRMPLTPSPHARTSTLSVNNSSPFTPERKTLDNESIKATKSTYGGNLSSHFSKSASRSSHRDSPKSNIARNAQTPRRALELGVSDFTLTGTGAKTPASSRSRKGPLRQKSTKTTLSFGDRFIPNRTASSAIATVGSGKLDASDKQRPKTSGGEGSSVLSSGADDALAALGSLSLSDDDEVSSSNHSFKSIN